MKIYIHRWINFINDSTITAYSLSPLTFVYEHASRNSEYSHTLAFDSQVLKMFGQGNSEDKNNKILDTFNTYNWLFRSNQGPYGRGHVCKSHRIDDQLPHLWHQKYSVGATQVFGGISCRITSKIVGIRSTGKNGRV